jgi:hypothetical protein
MSKYIGIYELLCPDEHVAKDDPRRGAIIAEMRAIEKAPTAKEAAQVIEWWDTWPNPLHRSALQFARQARKLMAK